MADRQFLLDVGDVCFRASRFLEDEADRMKKSRRRRRYKKFSLDLFVQFIAAEREAEYAEYSESDAPNDPF